MKKIYILVIFTIFTFMSNTANAQTIWSGSDYTFSKEANADWTLPENQDIINANVTLTRQNSGAVYNYTWWQSTFESDPTFDDLFEEFWGEDRSAKEFTSSGGTKGLRWCIIDDSGSAEDWTEFDLYGVLGNPSNFYSFHNIASIITALDDDLAQITSVDNDFTINGDMSSTWMTLLVGKKLGVWIVEDDVYFTLTFNTWGEKNTGTLSYTRSTDQLLGLNDFKAGVTTMIYPNPSSDFIQISGLAEVVNYKIYNIIGAEISSGNVLGSEKIDIKNLTNGLYFLKFENGSVLKFIKE